MWIARAVQRRNDKSIEHWLAFAAASAVLLAIPGPTVLLVISYTLGHGRKTASATVAGVALGDFTAMTASMLGLGSLLATSAALFTALKWIGAAYLVYLGIKLWRAPVATGEVGVEIHGNAGPRPSRVFLHTYIVIALVLDHLQCGLAIARLHFEKQHARTLDVALDPRLGRGFQRHGNGMIRTGYEGERFRQTAHGGPVDRCF